jgi:hypothetical protein
MRRAPDRLAAPGARRAVENNRQIAGGSGAQSQHGTDHLRDDADLSEHDFDQKKGGILKAGHSGCDRWVFVIAARSCRWWGRLDAAEANYTKLYPFILAFEYK